MPPGTKPWSNGSHGRCEVNLPARVARRYARAFFDLARRDGCAEAALRDLVNLSRLADECPEWSRFVGNYRLPSARRHDILERLFRDTLHPLTLSLVRLLESRRRLDLLGEVREAFSQWMDEAQGVRRMTVTSAYDLGPRGKTAVRESLSRPYGKAVSVTFETDRALLAGFVWQVGDQRGDRSAAGALAAWRKKLADV